MLGVRGRGHSGQFGIKDSYDKILLQQDLTLGFQHFRGTVELCQLVLDATKPTVPKWNEVPELNKPDLRGHWPKF